jgi:hypothetical protein
MQKSAVTERLLARNKLQARLKAKRAEIMIQTSSNNITTKKPLKSVIHTNAEKLGITLKSDDQDNSKNRIENLLAAAKSLLENTNEVNLISSYFDEDKSSYSSSSGSSSSSVDE